MNETTNSNGPADSESFDPAAWLTEFEANGGSVFYGDGEWRFGWQQYENDDADEAAAAFRSLTPAQHAAVCDYRDRHPRLDQATLRTVAEAWVNRWCALGGSFGRIFNADGSLRSICRGLPMPYTWEPPTWEKAEEMAPALRPHEHITEREQFEGAQKMLESFLTLVPGLQEAVHAIAEDAIEIAGDHATPEVIMQILALRRAEETITSPAS